MEIRVLRYSDPLTFLDATERFDDSFMNFCIGTLRDHLQDASEAPGSGSDANHSIGTSTSPVLLAICRGDDLLMTLTRTEHDIAWNMSIPCSAQSILTPVLLERVTTVLAEKMLKHAIHYPRSDPFALDVMGPIDALDAFLAAWTSLLLRTRGMRMRIRTGNPAILRIKPGNPTILRISYANRASLPPARPSPPSGAPSPLLPPSNLVLTRATAHHVDALAQLYADFQLLNVVVKAAVTPAAARAFLEAPIAAGLVWLCHLTSSGRPGAGDDPEPEPEPEPAGYILCGRVTPRTIAIRNVYIVPHHRRKGIAEATVCALTRYYLGVPPYGLDVRGVPAGDPPDIGVKDEVVLNVADASAAGVYKRAGFLLPDRDLTGGLDPKTGHRGWYSSILRGVELEEPEPADS